MSRTYEADVATFINKLSDKEFKRILDTPGGDRDHLIFNADLNSIEPAKLMILVKHDAYQLKNKSYEEKVLDLCITDDEECRKTKEDELKQFSVIKRDGRSEPLDREKIFERNRKIWRHPPVLSHITENDLKDFTNSIVKGIYNGISTSELDEQAAIIAAHMTVKHPDYGTLSSRIAISNHEKNLRNYSFMGVVERLYRHKDKRGAPYPLVSKELYKFVGKNKSWIESAIDYSRDYMFDFFGFKTLERAYLLKIQKTAVERPQDMIMRVAIGIWLDDTNICEIKSDSVMAKRILDTYHGMSQGYFIHASPTLFNSGTNHNQFLSCFLFQVSDSLEGIMNPQTDSAQISKYAGGNGCDFSIVRSKGAYIKGTNGESGGPIPFILNYDATMRAWDQGGRRKGALAAYMGAEHPQFVDHCELRTVLGDPSMKSKTIFIGTWCADLLWYRWMNDAMWSFFDPEETRTTFADGGATYGANRYLAHMFGNQYESRYAELESAGRARSSMKAHDLLIRVAAAQFSSGMPYMCWKDSFNRCNMQKNIGYIPSSNLCTEIAEPYTPDEYACCTLASIGLPPYVVDVHTDDELKSFDDDHKLRDLNHDFPKNPRFDFANLAKYVRVATRNLDNIIDKNKYPVYQTKLFNLRHRTLGIGAQGIADVFHKMKLGWGEPFSRELNLMIFETIYYAALVESCEIARELYLKYAAIARAEGKVKVIVDYQARPIVHKTTVTRFSGHEYAEQYERPKFEIEHIVEPIYKEYVLAGQPNPENLPILPKTAGAYCTFEGSPLSEGKFHFDLKNEESDFMNEKNAKFVASMNPEKRAELEQSLGQDLMAFLHRKKINPSDKLGWDWESLRAKIKTFGVRNAQLVALMPTSTTSQILGNNECIEPYTENIYKRTTLAGDFIVVNPYLIHELCDLGLWNESVENSIKINNGSVQFIDTDDLSKKDALNNIKYRYQTAFELSQKILIDMAADRQFFVDQSQSLNLHNNNWEDLRTIVGLHFYGWARGLKTGMYYLRSRQSMTAQKATMSVKEVNELKAKSVELTYDAIQQQKKSAQLTLDGPSEVCLSCSS